MLTTRRIQIAAAAVLGAISCGLALADTLYVNGDCGNDAWSGKSQVCEEPNGPKRTIQAGIDAANPGDTVLVADGLYTGRNNHTLNFRGKSITVRSETGAAETTIDAQRASSSSGFVFESGESADAAVDGFTITGATLSGIRVSNGAAPTVRACKLIANWSGLVGGGVNVDSSGQITLIDCVMDQNLAGQGGGINVWENAEATLIRCTISRNRVDITGGAAAMADRDSMLILESCIIRDNESIGFAGSSAGVRIARGSFGSFVNCLFYGNRATGSGAGVSITNDGAGEVINCTVARNHAAGSGAGLLMTQGVGDVVVFNTIFWENVPDQISRQGGNLSVTYSDIEGGYQGDGNIDADPIFADPDNGDYRLKPGSPCIDAADNTAVPEGIKTDLDGNPRFLDDRWTKDTGKGDPPIVDMGPYEFQPCNPCDTNCDGSVDLTDVELFIRCGLIICEDPCSPCLGDTNGDGSVDLTDVEGFIECLLG